MKGVCGPALKVNQVPSACFVLVWFFFPQHGAHQPRLNPFSILLHTGAGAGIVCSSFCSPEDHIVSEGEVGPQKEKAGGHPELEAKPSRQSSGTTSSQRGQYYEYWSLGS